MRSLHPVLKKWLSFIVVLALALSLAPGASALAPAKDLTDPEPTRTYNFYVDLNWKQTQVVKNGDTLVAPESPTTPEGWIFTSWATISGSKILNTPEKLIFITTNPLFASQSGSRRYRLRRVQAKTAALTICAAVRP